MMFSRQLGGLSSTLGMLSRVTVFLVAIVLVSVGVDAKQPQTGGQPAPSLDGQWAGPWDLNSEMTSLPAGGSGPYFPQVREIAGAAVLPPYTVDNQTIESAFGGKVLFINDRGANNPTYYLNAQPTYLWDPQNPWQIEEHVIVPNVTSADIFCSGYTFLGNGSLMTTGGLNRELGGSSSKFGIRETFALNVDSSSPQPGILEWSSRASQTYARWYPTATTLDSGKLLTTGNEGGPNQTVAEQSRQLYDPDADSWASVLNNQYVDALNDCNGVEDPLNLHDYPKVHMLSSGQLMWVDGEDESVYPPLFKSWFLSLTGDADCSGPNPYRFRDGLVDSSIEAKNRGGNSVHFVTMDWDPILGVWNPSDVVYAIAGTEHGFDDFPCPTEMQPGVTNAVLRMVAPGDNVPWETADPAGTKPKNLNFPRVNCNSVILLDGTILVVGGADKEGQGSDECQFRRKPELYHPPEIFRNLTTTQWEKMDPQVGGRQYHSVAGLLPDGRVFSAGGTAGNYGQQADPPIPDEILEAYRVELFSPPYFFRGPRPSIVTEFPNPVLYGTTGAVTISLRGAGENAQVTRMALVRNGSVTHAFDMNQRYVELRVQPVSLNPGEISVTVNVTWPTGGFEAPPGWYMLTAIANMDSGAIPSSANLPSKGVWIYLQ